MKKIIRILLIFVLTITTTQAFAKERDFGIIIEGTDITDKIKGNSDNDTTETKNIIKETSDKDEILLNPQYKLKYNTLPNYEEIKNKDIEYDKTPQQQNQNSTFNNEYTPKTTSFTQEKKMKYADVGAKYDTTFTPENAKQTRTLYAKKRFNKKMSVDTSYKTETLNNIESQGKGTVSISPEYRFNEHFAVKNTLSKNMSNRSTKEEASLHINPFKDKDRMDFNVGAAEVQYDNGSPSSSQINFGTNFKF